MLKLAKIRDNKNKKKVLIMIFLFSFIFIGLFPIFLGNIQKAEKIGENLLISPLVAEIHSEILIDGNTELDAFCEGDTDGSSWANACVIKDYVIDAGASGKAIEIGNTSLYLIIQNCTLTNSGDDVDDAGIYLTNCTNVKITGCNSNNNYNGFYLNDSYDCIITGNNASDNIYRGIGLRYSSNNTVSENFVSYNDGTGIDLFDNCENNIITGNNMSYIGEYGITLSSYCMNNTISENSLSDIDWDGIFLNGNTNNNNTISGNNVSYSDSGIYIASDNSTISGNYVSYSDSGIYIASDNNTVSGNIVSYNEDGIYIGSNSYNNTIWMNYISNNSISQGYSGSSSNWDNGTLGNYWGDFVERYPDATSSNGIWWDWEYEVNLGYNDTRPLVHPGFPEIGTSGNVDYMIGDEGDEISWTISDSTILDTQYWIYLDGVEIQTDSWGSGSIISIEVDGLSVGTYNYVLKCNDGTAWGWSECQIVVNVNEVPKPVITTTSQTISTENITVEWSEVVGVDFYNVYINGTLTYTTDTLTQNIWLNESGTYSITVTAINGAEESEHSDAIVIVVDIKSNVGIIIGSIGGSLVVVGVGAFLFLKKRRVPK